MRIHVKYCEEEEERKRKTETKWEDETAASSSPTSKRRPTKLKQGRGCFRAPRRRIKHSLSQCCGHHSPPRNAPTKKNFLRWRLRKPQTASSIPSASSAFGCSFASVVQQQQLAQNKAPRLPPSNPDVGKGSARVRSISHSPQPSAVRALIDSSGSASPASFVPEREASN